MPHYRSSSSDFLTFPMPRGLGELQVWLNHEQRELSVSWSDDGRGRSARLCFASSRIFSLGAGLTLEAHGDDQVHGSLHAGRASIYWALRGRLVRRLAALAGREPRSNSIELVHHDTETADGYETRLRVHLWDDDTCASRKRAVSLNLTELLFGKVRHSRDQCLEERQVTVAMPEGPHVMTARLMQRATTRPRWPLEHRIRWVTFEPCAILVPTKHSNDLNFYGHGPGAQASATAQSIRSGIAELVRQVLRDRETYGGLNWTPRPTPHEHDSHTVSFTDSNRLRGSFDLFHGTGQWVTWLPGINALACEETGSNKGQYRLTRDPVSGGLVLCRADDAPAVMVDGKIVGRDTSARVWQGSALRFGGADGFEVDVHYHPIGPVPPAVQMELVSTPDEAPDVAEIAADLDTTPPTPVEISPFPLAADALFGDDPEAA